MRRHYQNISRFWRQHPQLRIGLLVIGLVSGRLLPPSTVQQTIGAAPSPEATVGLRKKETPPQKDQRRKPHDASTDSTSVEIIYGIVGTSTTGD